MEDFSQNMVVLKRDKKDMLLTNKDPHLSHLFEHTGPRTPNSVSTSMNQSAMEVDGSFTETASEDYQLFEEQGGSYMPEFSPDAPNLIIDTGGREGYNNNNCTQRDGNITTTKTKDYPQQCKTETNAGHPFSMSESTESGFIPDSKFSSNQTKRIINHSSPEKVPQSNTTYTSKQEKASPPPDNYNMQLLAHHAQQHQQLMQKQKKKQQETFSQGSSNALQQFAFKARLCQERGEAQIDNPTFKPTFSYPFLANQVSVARSSPGVSYIKTNSQPYVVPLAEQPVSGPPAPFVRPQIHGSIPVPNAYGGWNYIDSNATKEVKHTVDLGFPSHDSQVYILQQNEGARTTPKLEFLGLTEERKPTSISLPTSKATVEPELKSPLDHPEHQQQRSRFFSTDSGAGSAAETALDDEAPINDRDKQAAAELSVLLEQSEKSNATAEENLKLGTNAVKAITQIKLDERKKRSTPPPSYDYSVPGDQMLQQYVQYQPNHEPSGVIVTSSYPHFVHAQGAVKQEPISPMTTFCTAGVSFTAPKNAPKISREHMYSQQQLINPEMLENRSRISSQCTESNTYAGNQNDGANYTHHLPVMMETNLNSPLASAGKQQVPGKPRRNSSSGSSSQRNSDGSLTCSLCGHSFRSTPALNGHMRVHSSTDKKTKDVSQNRPSQEFSMKPNNTPSSVAKVPNDHTFSNVPLNGMPLPYPSNPNMLQQPFVLSGSSKGDNQPHNGLLTMATAASLLKTDPGRSEYMYQPQPLTQAYVMPSGMLLQQPQMVNMLGQPFNDNGSFKLEGHVGNEQNMAYNPIYGPQVQNIRNLAFPLPNSSHAGMLPQEMMLGAQPDRENNLPTQPYDHAIPQKLVMHDNAFPAQYDPQQIVGTNSLSQLATIAVATANRDQLPDFGIQPELPTHFIPNEMPNAVSDPIPANSEEWMAGAPQNQAPQPSGIYGDSPVTQETTSPIRSGHDPFILPVTVPVQRKVPQDYNQYNSAVDDQTNINRVTWCDRQNVMNSSSPFSSYDDSLMRDAVNVANPSKILPNSMMGGTPTGSMFGNSSRPFRQRHHSEGSHLIKAKPDVSSILKQMLHSPVPAVKLRVNKAPEKDPREQTNATDVKPNPINRNDTAVPADAKDNKPTATADKPTAKTQEEIWAEPKPVQQRRVRRRRHSADCRLLKSNSYLYHSKNSTPQLHQGMSPLRKPSVLRSDSRVRHKPPPLVIPSSVSTFTPLSGAHSHFYHSHLHHHRRRPSGDSNSSYNGGNDKIPPYTPPPMLSPLRAGSGLYCTTPVTPSVKFLRQMSMETIPPIIEEDETQDSDDEYIRSTEPTINIGPRFQAVIPKLENSPKRSRSKLKHLADRIWKRVPQNEKVYSHLDDLMELSCSAVVPYGGSNKQYALHCLSKTKGDILSTVQRLLRRKGKAPTNTPPCKPVGSGAPWTPLEVKMFDCGMLEHRKDFCVISKMVKTRSTAECVDRYYHIVKRNRRKIQRPRRFRGDESDEKMIVSRLATSGKVKEIMSSSASSSEDERCANNDVPWTIPASLQQSSTQLRHTNLNSNGSHRTIKPNLPAVRNYPRMDSPAASPASVASSDDPPVQTFTCPVCGKSFAKVKSRNAHMKTHGKHAQEKRRLREEEERKRSEALLSRGFPNFKPTTVNTMLPPSHAAAINPPFSRFSGNI